MTRTLLAIASLLVLALVWAALDDITTGSEPSYRLEWLAVGLGALWFLGLLALALWRRRRIRGAVMVLLLLATGGFLAAPMALAQDSATLERLEIAIWPEYDKPSVLVILKAFLPPSALLPTTVSLPMPVKANQPTAVASGTPGSQLMNATWNFDVVGDFTIVAIEARAVEVRLEYYVPLDMSSPDRRFRFEWPGGPAAQRVVYEVMQPAGADGLLVVPSRVPPQTEADGLVYQRGDLGAVAAGQAFSIEIGYVKEGAGLTAAAVAPPGGAGAGMPQFQATPPPSQPTMAPSAATAGATSSAPPQAQGVSEVWRYVAVAAIAVALFLFFLLIRR